MTNSNSDDPVHVVVKDSIGIVTINNPPVNALGLAVRHGLMEALVRLRDDPSVTAIVITCAGSTFVAGADITEFGTAKATTPPTLVNLCDVLDTVPKPTIAAIHGTAMGGGLELALACHYRAMRFDAKAGLPEVKLGFIPGAGGTVRLPRVVGPEKALEMIVTGEPIGAQDALHHGLADVIATGDLLAETIVFGQKARGTVPPTPVRQRDDKLAPVRQDPAAFEVKVAALLAKHRGLRAPAACADAVRNAVFLPFAAAQDRERQVFLDLVSGAESKALRHLFFAEREAAKVPGIDKSVGTRSIETVGVVGAGTMGGGIAMAFLKAGIPVTLLDATPEALTRGTGQIDRNFAVSVQRGSISAAEKAACMGRLTGSVDYADLAPCDLIIEAAFEDMGVKKDIFARLGAIAKPGAVLATNTSYLDVDEIALASGRPGDVLGLHFFSPANVMKLLEIVRGKQTAPQVLAAAVALARRIGKIAVVVGVCPGFVGNRMLAARNAENEILLLEGASPAQVDKAFVDFGWAMGPFQMNDLAGLDIGWRNRKAMGKTAVLADALCDMGRFGQKTGGGWYKYDPAGRLPIDDPDVAALIARTAAEMSITRRSIDTSEIIERTLLPMINEAAKVLEEGIASRPSDIDVVWVNGYGFPKAKGGPMFWAAGQTDFDIAARLNTWFSATEREIFRPSNALAAFAAPTQRLAD